MLTEYELIIIEPGECGEVITFKSSAIFDDFNDIDRSNPRRLHWRIMQEECMDCARGYRIRI